MSADGYIRQYPYPRGSLIQPVNGSEDVACRQKELWMKGGRGAQTVSISEFPDVALLEIFDFFMAYADANAWHTLVHVCRRWRCVVFASPRRLGLKLLCTNTTPVKRMLDIWPILPIVIDYLSRRADGVDNIFSALGHRDYVCRIDLCGITNSQLKRLAAVEGPFPALTYLSLSPRFQDSPVLPDSFLGGSAPRLREIWLLGVAFPSLPNLLLSARDLVDLSLEDIPYSGYIPPQAIVDVFSALTCLEYVHLEFRSPRSRPDQASQRVPLQPRIFLPALLTLHFKGVSEYLEVLSARISAPQLRGADITFFNQLAFDISRFPLFIGGTESPRAPNRAEITIGQVSVDITISPHIKAHRYTGFKFKILCRELDWQLSSLAQVCGSFLTPFTTLERLDIREVQNWRPLGQGDSDMDDSQWLEVLSPFTSVKDLYLSKKLAIRIAPALQDLAADIVADVLPVLQNLFLKMPEQSGPVKNAFAQFLAARRLSGQPVVVHHWKSGRWKVGLSGDN